MRRLFLGFLATLASLALGWTPAEAAGTLRAAVGSDLNTLDAHKAKIGEEYNVLFLVFSGLTQLDRSMKAQPDLAEKWERSDDLKTWTFHLRKGVKFHHGRELDSSDVVANVERVLDKATASVARTNLLVVDKVEAVDKHTVRFQLKVPYSTFPELLGERQLKIIPKDKFDTAAREPVGSGPFKFKTWIPSDRVDLVRNPDYFGGPAKLDGVTIKIIKESAAQIAALESGQVDLIWQVPLEAIQKVKQNPDTVVDSVPTSSWDALVMNQAHKPFNDVRVRQAVALVIDKPALVELALFGNGTPTHTPIPPVSPYFNKTLPIKTDAAKAKKLLAEAGFPNGFEVTLYVPVGRPTRERYGIAAQQMLKEIGIKADVQRVPWDKFVADIEGKAAFYTDGFFSRPTIDTSTYAWYHSGGSWNTTLWNYKNPETDKLLDAARGAKSEDELARILNKFQEVAVNDSPGVIGYVWNHVNAHRKNVKGFKSHPMMWLDVKDVTVQ
jgi:peptide/nickel transport system substrate-binding protein